MAQYDINLREYWRILKKRKFIVVLTAVILGVFSTAFAVFRAPIPIYTTACSIQFERETTVEGLYAKTLSWSGADDMETQISIIKSYKVFRIVAEEMGVIPIGKGGDPKYIGAIESLKSKIEVYRQNFTNILNIEARDTDPAFARKLANTVAKSYKDLHSKQQTSRTDEAIKYIEDQLKTVAKKLEESEDDFNRFTQANQLISIDMQSENLLMRSEEINSVLRELNDQNNEFTIILNRLNAFIKKPSSSENNFFTSHANPQYQQSNDTLVELLLKKETLLEDFTPKHPQVVNLNRKVMETANKMTLILEQELNVNENRVRDLNDELIRVEQKTSILMEKKLEFDRLKRKVLLYTDMTALLEKKNQEAMITKAEKPEEVSIVKPALLPSFPINPPKTASTGAMGVLIGLVLGLVTAFIIETFDTSLGAIEDVEDILGVQVIGVVPFVDLKEIQETFEEAFQGEIEEPMHMLESAHLISHYSPKSMIAESFRAIRTNVQFKESEDETKVISVTSTSPQEGKSLGSTSLSITMAQAGMKTLMIGADMRKPMISKVFGVEKTPGLSDILMGNYPWRDTVKTITDLIMGKMSLDEVMITPGLDNLHLITSGTIPPNPAVLIESKRLMEFIEEAKKEYDVIIFDSPPILSTADAAILGSKMDGIILVYRVGSVSRGLLKRSTTQLEQANCNIIGVVLNGMKPELSPDFSDYKYYSYYYSYSEEQDAEEESQRGLNQILPKIMSIGESLISRVKPAIPSSDKKIREVKKYRETKIWQWILLIIAVLFLAGAVLWQNGFIDPMGTSDKKVASKKATPEKPIKKVPDKVKVDKRITEKKPPVEKVEIKKAVDSELIYEPSIFEGTIEKINNEPDRPPIGLEEPISYPYSIYIGSFKTMERAETAISAYKKKGLEPYWAKVVFSEKGEWFRVFTGQFTDQERAETFAKENDLEGAEIKKTEYANLIDIYTSSEDLDKMAKKIKDLGFSPYIIKAGKNKKKLFVGAYITEAGARQQQEELQDVNIAGQVVNR